MTLLSCPTIASEYIYTFGIVRAQLRRRASGLGICHWGEVLGLPTERLNSPALRGFMRKVRWNDGLGLGEDTRNCAVN